MAGSVALADTESIDRPSDLDASTPQIDTQDADSESPNADRTLLAQEEDDVDNNETQRHERPDEARGDGDQDALVSWLSNELGGALGGSTVELSEGQYDQARSVIGDDYDERLEQYVEVSDGVDTGGGDTDSEEETDPVEEFEQAQEDQREFVDSVQAYQETYEEYEAAREAGDEQRARTLARELEQYAERVSESSDQVISNYDTVSERTDQELDEESETVEEIDDEIDTTQSEVREAEFDRTEIVADVDSPSASFVDPLIVSGAVATVDGQPVDGGEVAVLADGRVTTTEVINGNFQLEYRPALLPANASELTVTYVPNNESVYLDSATNVSIDPGTVQPTVEVTGVNDSVTYGDTVVVEGMVGVDTIPVDQVPVAATFVDQQPTNLVRTDENGTFTVEIAVPVDVPAGESELEVGYPLGDRSLERSATQQPITVEETDTELRAEAFVDDTDTIEVRGTLYTDEEEPVANQSVELLIDGTPVETVETGEEGEFQSSISVPADSAEGTVEFVVSYEDPETNLGDDRLTIELQVGDGSIFGNFSHLYWGLGGVVVVVLGIAIFVGWLTPPVPTISGGLFASGGDSETERIAGDGKSEDEEEPDQTAERETESGVPMPDTAAEQLLESGDADAATAVAYALARRRLEAEVDRGSTKTHWEFYDAWSVEQNGKARESLEQLTELYERAAYASAAISQQEASTAINVATHLADGERGTTEN